MSARRSNSSGSQVPAIFWNKTRNVSRKAPRRTREKRLVPRVGENVRSLFPLDLYIWTSIKNCTLPVLNEGVNLSADFGSTTQYNISLQHESEKPLSLCILAVSAEHRRNNNT